LRKVSKEGADDKSLERHDAIYVYCTVYTSVTVFAV
jgi:hypothetical protein